MGKKSSEFIVRSLSGLLLGVVVIGAIMWSQWSLAILLLAIIAGGSIEFYRIAEMSSGAKPQRFIGGMMAAVLFSLNFAFVSDDIEILGWANEPFKFGLAFLMLLFPIMLICELYRRQAKPLTAIATTIMSVLYVALPLSLVLYIPIISTNTWQPLILVIYLFIIWANDIFAYLIGIAFGRNRLFERISPKKSWEGAIGGLAGGVGVAVGAAIYLEQSIIVWIGLAVVTVVSAIFGDLVESMFKRSVDIKDSGSLIPGHGGVLDRFDAVLVSAPFVVVYMLIVM